MSDEEKNKNTSAELSQYRRKLSNQSHITPPEFNLNIRVAVPEDLNDIVHIENTAHSPWNSTHVSNELKYPDGIHLVASTEKEKIVGWVCARLLPPEAELLKITISEDHRNMGVGTQLMERLQLMCGKSGCNLIFLEVREQNVAAKKFYEKLGFSIDGLRRNYYHDPSDNGLIYRKKFK